MSSRPLRLLILAFCVAASGDARARVSYVGPGHATATGVIDDSEHGVREIRPADVVPDVGELIEIDEHELVFERPLSEEERALWKAAGGVVPDIERLHLYRRPAPLGESSSGAATTTIE